MVGNFSEGTGELYMEGLKFKGGGTAVVCGDVCSEVVPLL